MGHHNIDQYVIFTDVTKYQKWIHDKLNGNFSQMINVLELEDTKIEDQVGESCGKIHIKANPLISHGQSTYSGQYPWHVALFSVGYRSKKYLCGGSIIAINAILTAAHCVDTYYNGLLPAADLRVEAGRHDLTITGINSQNVRVLQVIVHDNFIHDLYQNNVALLKLDPLRFTNYVQPICLTDDDSLFENEMGMVPGWGLTELSKSELSQSYELIDIAMPILSRNDCVKRDVVFYSVYLGDGSFCAGFGNGFYI